MNRKILLIEPNYKNKYPPIGLMKIATYHRILGDNVRFFKGNLKNFIVDEIFNDCLNRLKEIDNSINWDIETSLIKEYIKTKRTEYIERLQIDKSPYQISIAHCLSNYANIFRKKLYKQNPNWDRVYITTLFTFYWKITIETIEFAKCLVKNQGQLLVGGIMASLLYKEIEETTGVKTHQGLLDKPGILDPENILAKTIIIDDLPLDYSILDEIDYEYPTRSAYFTFMTKGCTRKCAFCSVPILEPAYKPKIETKGKFYEIKEKFGEQQNLLLMDNNVLASPNFSEIIDEIKEMGFYKGATFIEPNQLDIAIKNLENKTFNNESAFIKRCFKLLSSLTSRLKDNIKQDYYNILAKYKLLRHETITKENLLLAYNELKAIYENYRLKTVRLRYVDFNQGTDARYVNEDIMKKMSEIPIRPLRLAFDYIGIKEKYINAVRLAAKYRISELSNYILYNFNDAPADLYNRLEINIKLNEELGTRIFSFPMKYIPLFGEEAKGRDYIGKKWNKKFIRAIQSILNVTKGIIAPGKNFFEEAFGKDIYEFYRILYMPEAYIIYRKFFREAGLTETWWKDFNNLSDDELETALPIILKNDFKNLNEHTTNANILNLLKHYTLTNKDLRDADYNSIKRKFDKLIKEDQFMNLTLTYDFE